MEVLLLSVAILLLLLAIAAILLRTIAILLLVVARLAMKIVDGHSAAMVAIVVRLTVAILVLVLLLSIAVLLLLTVAILSLLTVAVLSLLMSVDLWLELLVVVLLAVAVLLLLTVAILLLLLAISVLLRFALVTLIAIVLHSIIAIVVLSVLLLGQVAHELIAVVRLIGGPSGGSMRHHTVATNVTICDTSVHVVVVLGELNESILLVLLVRCGRNWMRVGDVMTTEIITTVHGVLHILWKVRLSSIFVQWLPDWTCSTAVVVHFQLLERGPLGINGFCHCLAGTVGSNDKVLLHLVADNGPLRRAHWPIVATEIVIDEELAAVATCLTLGEEGVRKEHR